MAKLKAVLLALCVIAASHAEAKFFHHLPAGCSAALARRHVLPHPSLTLRLENSASCRAGCFSQSFSFFRFHDDGNCNCLRACSMPEAGSRPSLVDRPNSENSVPAQPPSPSSGGTHPAMPMAPPPVSTIHKPKGHCALEGAGKKFVNDNNDAPRAEPRLGIALVLQLVGDLLKAWH